MLLDKVPIEILDFMKSEEVGVFYLVGGCIRDLLLERTPKDWDIVTTAPEVMERRRYFQIGKSFPVWQVKLNGYTIEVAAARKEKKVGNSHTDFEYELISSINGDVLRRDLTINTFALDSEGNLTYANDAMDDLNDGILKHVTDAFDEDPLRVFRVARFAAQLGFYVHPVTIRKMFLLRNELKYLSKERVRMELEKALVSKYPHRFFEVLREACCLDQWFPQLENLVNVTQGEMKHPEGGAFEHTMLCLQEMSKSENFTLEEMLCVLGHDFGKGYTDPTLWPHHYDHDKLGAKPVKEFCETLGYSKQACRSMLTVAKYHMMAHRMKDLKAQTLRKLLLLIRKTSLGIAGFGRVCMADSNGRSLTNRETLDKVDYLVKAYEAMMSVKVNPKWTLSVIEQEQIIALKKFKENYGGNSL